ncbi:MAG: hypothetical protein RL173_1532 [Fibrobacterota bacterium]|jgi:hypothetical protein
MTQFPHLAAGTAEAMALPKQERISYSQKDFWVGYPRAVEVMNSLDQLLSYPKASRMPNILLVGATGNGKSSILESFVNRHPVEIKESGEPIVPVLYIEMSALPSESDFWSRILWALCISHREKDLKMVKEQQAKSVMRYAGVRLIVIDEFNNVMNMGKKAGELLSVIRGLSNTMKIPIVASGTQVSMNALNSDPTLKSRFQPMALNRWQPNAEYLRFIANYEKLLPLAEPSGLVNRTLAPLLYGMAGDTLGGTVKLIRAAAAEAIQSGEEKITEKILKRLEWTKPDRWDEASIKI